MRCDSVVGIGGERRLLADQLDLLFDARELRVDVGHLPVGLAAALDALPQDRDLPLEAAS